MGKVFKNEQSRPHTFLSRLRPFKFFKACLPQILLGPCLNTWTQIFKYS